jgi:hypothetical protein
MEIRLVSARYLIYQSNGEIQSMDLGSSTLTANDAGCAPVPARATTWGAIRGQYR